MDFNRNGNRRRGDISNHFNDGRGNESEWESSFAQILSRTKENIDRVNDRYGSSNSSSSAGFNDE
jgi:hypothetical protein